MFLCGTTVAHALTRGLGEDWRREKSFGIKAKNSSVSFSVGQSGNRPTAAYKSEEQMIMKGKPSGGAKLSNAAYGLRSGDDMPLTNFSGTAHNVHTITYDTIKYASIVLHSSNQQNPRWLM